MARLSVVSLRKRRGRDSLRERGRMGRQGVWDMIEVRQYWELEKTKKTHLEMLNRQ